MKKWIALSLVIMIGVLGYGYWDFYIKAKEFKAPAEVAEEVEEVEVSGFYEKLEAGQEATVVFLGDSTTEQNETTDGELNHVGLMREWFEEKYPDQVKVVNAGISGNTISQMQGRLSTDVLNANPDMVVISSGLNDALGTLAISPDEFEESYTSILETLKEDGVEEIVVRTPNLTLNPSFNEKMAEYLDMTETISEDHGTMFFDFYEQMASDIKADVISHEELMKDSIHPNAEGQEYIFENFKEFFENEVLE